MLPLATSVVILVLICPASLGCGISTHIEIAYRTREHFELISNGVDYADLLSRHEDALQAGAPYPDAYYPGLCFGGIYHDIAEDTHWTPFMTTMIEYIRENYPQPWNRQSEKLVVFLLSIIVHQVSDATWHSLGIDQGFLRAMGNVNYHGSFGDAHTAGDFGGDVVNLYELDMDYVGRLLTWYVPTEDLVEIYHEYYGEVIMTEEIIDNCTRWLFLGRLGENIGVIDLLYPLYARGSTFLIDHLNDYFLGGMDDMAVWCGNTWQRAITMLNNGTEVCDTPNNPIYIRCQNEDAYDTSKIRQKREAAAAFVNPSLTAIHTDMIQTMEALIAEADLQPEDVDVIYEDGGIYLSPGTRIQDMFSELIREKHSMEATNESFNDTVLPPTDFYPSTTMFARMGEHVTSGDMNNDGIEDLVVTAPGFSTDLNYMRGAVYIFYGSNDGFDAFDSLLEDEADVVLLGPELNGRFGTSVSVVDINMDGINDLAVSAPSVGSVNLNYEGEVYIYLGTEDSLSTEPSVTIACEQRYCNLGWSLSASDVDGNGFVDLLVGSPFAPAGGEQRGFVGLLTAKQSYNGDAIILSENDFDWSFSGEMNYGWLGYSVSAYTTPSGTSWVAAGAPTTRICASPDCDFNREDIQAVGRVYVFEGPALTDEPSMVYYGDQHFAQLGAKVTSGRFGNTDVLAVVSPTRTLGDPDEEDDVRNQSGEVILYDLSDLEDDPIAVFTGDRPYARFGADIMFLDIDNDDLNDIVITAPLRSETFRNLEEAGRAFGFSSSTTDTKKIAENADIVFGMEVEQSRFGYSATSVGSSLVFGCPHHNNGDYRLAGGLAVYNN